LVVALHPAESVTASEYVNEVAEDDATVAGATTVILLFRSPGPTGEPLDFVTGVAEPPTGVTVIVIARVPAPPDTFGSVNVKFPIKPAAMTFGLTVRALANARLQQIPPWHVDAPPSVVHAVPSGCAGAEHWPVVGSHVAPV
jgi:hypothetical protein